MRVNRKLNIVLTLAATVAVTVAATNRKSDPPKFVNLKVLPKDISSRELQSIMADDLDDGLGVSCGFCHASGPDGHGLDFASDAKPEKAIARQMIRMTLGLNKKYLGLKHPRIGDAALVVSCNTCHKGQAFPDGEGPK